MDFRFDDEQLALRNAVQALCQQHFALATIADREGAPPDPASWRALADMGVFGLLLPSAGAGVTYAAVAFEQLGAYLAPGPLLWTTIAAPLVSEAAAGAIRVAGADLMSGRAPYVVEHAADSDIVVIVRDQGITSVPTAELPEPLGGGEPFDPLTPALAFRDLPVGNTLGGPDEAYRLRLAGTVLAAAQLVGVAQGALDVASAYALERHQFGVPIGSFQAVKHLLADMYVRVELARAATYAAAAIFDDARTGDIATAASTAKLLAGEAGLANGRTAVQVLGGMGFTWEMTPHYFLKRAWVLEQTFGTADAHALALAWGDMDLTYSAADEQFRTELRAWLEAEVPRHGSPPPPGDWPARRAYDTAWQRKLYDAGYAGLQWPAAFGGRGLPVSQQLVYLEEYARADAPYISVNFVGLMHAGPTLIAEGTDEQRAFHLPRILQGESVWCQGFSEPQAGSDLASLRTRAVREGDEYIVNGQKIWSTRAHVADYCELLVRTDPNAPKHKGITWLILDMHQPGVEVRPMRTIDGESHFCEVFLDDAHVPVTNRVGAENDGWHVTNVTLRFERGTAFAQHIITLRSQLRALVALARATPTDSGTAWDDIGFRKQVGRLQASVDGLWRMTQMGIAEAERTGTPARSGSAVKLRYSEITQEIADLAVRTIGRPTLAGATDADRDAVRNYLWSLQYTIAAGTSQIQRNLIAERILGMPR